MNETTKKMLAELDAAIMNNVYGFQTHLPEAYHDDRRRWQNFETPKQTG